MREPDRKTIRIARKLRANQTDAETVLWNRIRKRQVDGHKFVRQLPIAGYVCDFVCRERRLVVEVDGGQHYGSAADAIRDRRLADDGYRALRFLNNDVLGNTEGVLTVIPIELAKQPLTPTLSPRRRAGRGSPATFEARPPRRKSLFRDPINLRHLLGG